MLDLAERLLPRLRAGDQLAAVSVTRVHRSAPHGVGTTMAVTADGAVIGSISGGCVESDSVALALSVLGDGEARSARFGFSEGAAHAAGLACGGAIDVIAYVIRSEHAKLLDRATHGRPLSVGVVASGPGRGRVIPDPDRFAPAAVATRSNVLVPSVLAVESAEPADLLVISRAPRPRLIILGAGEYSAALCSVATVAGYAVTVCDPWEPLVTAERFPDADERIAAFPEEYLATLTSDDVDRRTAICVLTHDERLDVPALRVALGMSVGFVGAMGARSTAARRAALLAEAGVDAAALKRLHSPLGLDLGAVSPSETAISILAEITAARYGGTGLPLGATAGAVHHLAIAGKDFNSC